MTHDLWEYHFGLHTCNLSAKTKTVVNPFTRQEFAVPVDDGLTEQETKVVQKIFADHGVNGPFDVDYVSGYSLYANEWGAFQCFKLGGTTPVEAIDVILTVSDLSDEILEMLFRLAREGNLALISRHGNLVRTVGRQPNSMEIARWPDVKELSSVTELRYWLMECVKGNKVSNQHPAVDSERIVFSSPASIDSQLPTNTREQRFPKRLIPVFGLLLLLLVTNAIGSLSHIDAVTAWESATLSRIVTWSLNITSLLFCALILYGLFRRRNWSVTAVKWFIGLYYVAMVAKHAYFSPIARWEPFKYAVVYGVIGVVCFGFVLLLTGRRVSNYFDR